MKRLFAALIVAGLSTALAAQEKPNTLTAKEKSEGWIQLFDGKTLNGWTPALTAEWKVVDGAISPESDKNGYLFTNETYDNFALRLEFRTTPDVNSGIFLRYNYKAPTPGAAKGGGAPGYEVQIRDGEKRALKDSPAGFDTGSLVGALKAEKAEIVPGQWNRFEITAQGDHFTVAYNGKPILDGHDAKFSSGKIGLQWAPHTVPGKTIEFRSIKVKRLN